MSVPVSAYRRVVRAENVPAREWHRGDRATWDRVAEYLECGHVVKRAAPAPALPVGGKRRCAECSSSGNSGMPIRYAS